MNRGLVHEFKNPGNEYRGAPFWALNGKLDPEELKRQIRLMHRMGLGGFFMHSRVGLDTKYLSDEWFDCIKACVGEAKKLNMRAWLYDEDRWPSGAAGGIVTQDPQYRARQLVLEEMSQAGAFRWEENVLEVFVAEVDGHVARKLRGIPNQAKIPALAPGETLLVFKIEINKPRDWFNGQTYLDILSREAVQKFIRVTHEAYRKNIGEDFGKIVPGIFCDEPEYGHICAAHGENRYATVWTGKLPQVFRSRYGYDLLAHLPELFFDVADMPPSQARYHYMDCITHLFTDAFFRQVGEWCDKNNMLFTGHVLGEDTLSRQTHVVGSCMRCYEHMQAPGMDLLTEHWRVYDTAKQLSSAARQFGRKWRLTETYGCTGWAFPFAGHKALGDWQAALGVNLRCQHLAWYTMLGEAKRDYPASIFYQSPWWELYPKVEDYFARIFVVMTQGTEVRDLLVIHPVESMWTLTRKGWFKDPATIDYDSMLISLRDSLLMEHVDFDYGDEELLSRHSKVTKKDGVAILHMGKAEYRAVLVPPLKTMRSTTLALLKKFQKASGLVVFAGDASPCVDALPSDVVATFAATCAKTPAKGPALARAVEKITRRLSITDDAGKPVASALHLLREDKESFYLFVCNTGHTKGELDAAEVVASNNNHTDATMVRDRQSGFGQVLIRGFAACAGQPVELDPASGAMHLADARRQDGEWVISTSLPPLGSRLFVISKKTGNQKGLSQAPAFKPVRSKKLGGKSWPVTLSENNALVLDRPRFKIGAGGWKPQAEILKVDMAVRDALGIKHRGGEMVQPWAREKPANPKRVEVTLAYTFEASAVPSGSLFLGVERPETFKIAVNGTPLDMDVECGWWCDQSLRKIPVNPALIRVGSNEVVMTCDYSELHSGLEIAYLLGNFGTMVRGTEVRLTPPPTALRMGDWVKQGLAFYSGSVSYNATIKPPALRKGERLFVQVPEYRGVAVRVLANGKSAGVIAWEPNEVDITDFVTAQPVELRIEVIGHRRNSHGPLHHAEKWPSWTGPNEYKANGDKWREDYSLVPCGLLKPPQLVVKKTV